ncbi:MAG: DNA polymerase III subunit chi [Novosphingobium sp.]
MRVDFYQLSRDPAELALPLIARATLQAGERLLVVSGDEAQLGRIDEALWTRLPESFLAHGRAGEGHAARQPILLSAETTPANDARYLAIADGAWRETSSEDQGETFTRVFYLFNDATLQAARDCWRMLGTRDGLERRFWKQDGGKWVEGP